MSDIHPEELLDAARAGTLGPAEQRRLAEHTAHCSACRLQLAMGADARVAQLPQHDDAQRLARATAAALASLGDHSGAHAPLHEAPRTPDTRTRTRTGKLALLALGAGLIGLSSAAAYWVGQTVFAPEPGGDAPAAAAAEPAAGGAPAPPAPRATNTEPPIEPQAERPSAAEPAIPPSAAALLRQANRARGAGRYHEAAQLYRRLQALHPRSREHAVSQVALGRLLLDRMQRPAAALRQFDAYLVSNSDGVLSEEARLGRALALEKLGRHSGERAAWEALLSHHPASPHAARARQQLRQLGAPPPR